MKRRRPEQHWCQVPYDRACMIRSSYHRKRFLRRDGDFPRLSCRVWDQLHLARGGLPSSCIDQSRHRSVATRGWHRWRIMICRARSRVLSASSCCRDNNAELRLLDSIHAGGLPTRSRCCASILVRLGYWGIVLLTESPSSAPGLQATLASCTLERSSSQPNRHLSAATS
jgi:hypothetical protein